MKPFADEYTLFLTLIATRSVNETCARLDMSRRKFNKCMNDLNKALGRPVLHKVKNQWELTEVGSRLYFCLRNMRETYRAMLGEIKDNTKTAEFMFPMLDSTAKTNATKQIALTLSKDEARIIADKFNLRFHRTGTLIMDNPSDDQVLDQYLDEYLSEPIGG